MKGFIKIYLNCLFLSCAMIATAQQGSLQVVTKTIEKTVEYKDGFLLSIDGEKADVEIQTWENDQVKVVIELIAKNESLETAKKDLESMRYNIEVVGKKIFVRNYLAVDKRKAKSNSVYKAVYSFTVPADCPVDLRNHFGKANIKDLRQAVDVKSEFCEIQLDNIKGRIGVETRFGDVEGKQIDGQMMIESIRSDITLTQIKGKVDINAKYGKIKIDANQSLLDLSILAEKTDILFLNPATETYDFNLTAFYGEISVPDIMNFDFKEQNSTLNKAELNLPKQEGKVSIQTSFGNIVVVRVE